MGLWNDGRVVKWVGFPDGLEYDWNDVSDWFTRLEADPTRHHFVVPALEISYCGEAYYAVEKAHQRAGCWRKMNRISIAGSEE